MTSICKMCDLQFDCSKNNLKFTPDKCVPCFRKFVEQNPLVDIQCIICKDYFQARNAYRKTCYNCAKNYAINKGSKK